jgi:hypothetical protein
MASPLAPAPSPAPCWTTRAPRHASRHPLPTRSGRPLRPAALESGRSATRRARALYPAVIPDRISNLTPRITRPPASSAEHDIVRVAGRVHALVRPPQRSGASIPRHRAASFRRSNAAHHAPPHEIAEDDISRVGGRVHALVRRRPNSRTTRSAQHPPPAPTPTTRKLNHARCARRICFLSCDSARKPLSFVIRYQPPNARHHPPRGPAKLDDITRVRGRVHATVRPLTSAGLKHPSSQPGAFRRPNAAHHAPPLALREA